MKALGFFLLSLAGSGCLLRADTMAISLFPPGSASPINFEAERSNVVTTATGYMVAGDVSLITPLGKIVLLGSNLFFGFAPGTQQVQSMKGQAYVPSPFTSAVASFDKPVLAEVGFDLGKNLSLGVMIQAKAVWDAAPKQDILQTVSDSIQSGAAAAPRMSSPPEA